MTTTPTHEDLLKACAAFVPRLGAQSFEIRFSEPDDPEPRKACADPGPNRAGSPTVWIAIAFFAGAPPQVAAALSPGRAAFRLLEDLVDGGQCAHCKRPTGITDGISAMPAARAVCWYQFDPELVVFRRGCE